MIKKLIGFKNSSQICHGIGSTEAMEVPIYTTPTPVDGEWAVGRMVVYYSYNEGVSRYQGKGTNDVHVSYTDFAGNDIWMLIDHGVISLHLGKY